MPFRGKRSRRPRLNKTRKSRTKKVSKAVKTYVKRAIHSNSENKVFLQYGANNTLVTAAGSVPSNIYLTPFPSQGSQQSNRVGNQIKVVKAFVRGHVNLLPYSQTSNPQVGPLLVKMWLCSSKLVNGTNTMTTSGIDTNFFEANNTNISFQGNVLDIELTNNKDNWTIYKTKTFELGTTAANSALTTQAAGWLDNSKFTMPFYFSFTRYMRKQLKFNDTVQYATNHNLWLVFQAVYADGTSAVVNAAEYHYCSRVEYEDA